MAALNSLQLADFSAGSTVVSIVNGAAVALLLLAYLKG